MSDIKTYALPVLGGLALLFGGYAFGRYAAPEKVVTKTEVKVVQTEHVVEKVVTQVQVVKVSEGHQRVHTETYEVKHPDGTDEKKETSDTNVDTVVHEQDTKYVDVVHERETVKYVDKLVEKTVESKRPGWRLGALAGFSIPETLGDQKPGYRLLPSLGPLMLGLDLDKRLFGPISVGVWGLSSGAVGAKISLEW